MRSAPCGNPPIASSSPVPAVRGISTGATRPTTISFCWSPDGAWQDQRGCSSFPSSQTPTHFPAASSRTWSTSIPASRRCWRSRPTVEIGRVALAHRFNANLTLMALFRGLLIAARSGFSVLHGLVSYNHFAYSDAINKAFLRALMQLHLDQPCTAAAASPINEISRMTQSTQSATFRPWKWRSAKSTARTSVYRCCCANTST